MAKKAFVFDPNRCTGCHACAMACDVEDLIKRGEGPSDINSIFTSHATSFRQIYSYNSVHMQGIPAFSLSLACNHCEHPTCMENCPALAYTLDEQTGAIVGNPDKCIGCKYCTWACPYDAPQFEASAGVVRKCDFCVERQKMDLAPACVTACPVSALTIQERDQDTDSSHVTKLKGFPETELDPSIRFRPLRGQGYPLMTQESYSNKLVKTLLEQVPIPIPKISAKKEWTLVVFTWLMTALISFFCGTFIRNYAVNALLFVAISVFAILMSTMHLGNKKKMYRAIFNLRRSWLSREILSVSFFVAGAGYTLLCFDGWIPIKAQIFSPVSIKWAAGVFGILALISMDKVYAVLLKPGQVFMHSASNTLSACFYVSVLCQAPEPAILFGGLKLALFIKRIPEGAIWGRSAFIRLLVGIGIPMFVSLLGKHSSLPEYLLLGVFGLMLIGEFLDRWRFYNELSVTTPAQTLRSEFMEDVNQKLRKKSNRVA